ncbi:protein cortex-like [Periplaneta americana]|uniref:protein cortex-like n=1 Tax=Periplaneta americana TaxID=6978 RepID=UPI0037E7370E
MFLQFTGPHYTATIPQIGDRFISPRHLSNKKSFHLNPALAENQEDEELLDQDLFRIYRYVYSKHLLSALNLASPRSRLLRFSHSSPRTVRTPPTNHWPVRSRKRPLFREPHHLLDLPDFEYDNRFNLVDWGPSRSLAAVLLNSVYVYAPGKSRDELTFISIGCCTSVKWDLNGENLAIGGSVSTVQIWNVKKWKRLQETVCDCFANEISPCIINALAWHPNNTEYVSACSKGNLTLFSLPFTRKDSILVSRAHDGQIFILRNSPDGRFLASSGEDEVVRLWCWPDLTPGMEILSPGDPIRAMAWHPWQSSYLVIGGSMSGDISLWNVNKQEEEAYKNLGPSASICTLEWSSLTGELVAGIWIRSNRPTSAASHNDSEVHGLSVILVLESLVKVVDRIEFQGGALYHLVWSKDGKEFAVAGSDETLRIYYFLGPSSAKEEDISKLLKPMDPFSFIMNKRKTEESECNASKKIKHSDKVKCPYMKNQFYNIHNTFGCIIR